MRTKLDIYVIIGQDYKEQFFIVALHDFEVSAAYLAGTDGIISDSLSRWHLYKNHPHFLLESISLNVEHCFVTGAILKCLYHRKTCKLVT